MTGGVILLRKELLESWRTLRLPIVAGLFLLVGLTAPLLAKFLPEIIKAAAGDQLPSIPLPTPVAADAVTQTWKNLAQFGAFAAIILAMGAVSTERDRGTAAFVLSKTVSRGAFIAAKVAAIGAILAMCTALAVAVAWIYAAILFEPLPVAGLDRAGGPRLARSGGLGRADVPRQHRHRARPLLRPGSVSGRWSCCRSRSAIPNVGRFLPGGLAAPAIALASGVRVDAGDVVTPVVATAGLIVVAIGAAGWSFGRQEL